MAKRPRTDRVAEELLTDPIQHLGVDVCLSNKPRNRALEALTIHYALEKAGDIARYYAQEQLKQIPSSWHKNLDDVVNQARLRDEQINIVDILEQLCDAAHMLPEYPSSIKRKFVKFSCTSRYSWDDDLPQTVNISGTWDGNYHIAYDFERKRWAILLAITANNGVLCWWDCTLRIGPISME